MAGMLEYKCPCCDGAIQFDSATQKMKCPYCDTEFDVDTLKGYDEELKDEKPSEMEWATPGGSWAEGETAGLHTYSCKSCGGEIVGDDTMAASACPFCGNPIVLTGQFAGTLRPDLIIPFKLDKKAAKAKLQEHLKGKTLLPRVCLLYTSYLGVPAGLGLPHSEQNLPLFTAPQLQVQPSAAAGRGLPHSGQNLPVTVAPQLQVQLSAAGFGSGFLLPHSGQNLPVTVAPQLHCQPSAGAGAGRLTGWGASTLSGRA